MVEQQLGTWCNKMVVGYVRTLKLIATTSIAKFDEPLIHYNNEHHFSFDNFELKEDAIVYTIDFYKKECSFVEKQINDNNGVRYQADINFSLRTSQELTDFLYKNENSRFVGFLEDQNGKCYVVGSIEFPLLLLNTRTIDSLNKQSLTLFGLNWHSAWYIEHIDFKKMGTQVLDLRRYATRDIIAYQGDTISEVLQFKDNTGAIENLTGCSFKLEVRDSVDALIQTFSMGAGFTLQNSNTELLMKNLGTLPAGDYVYDLQRTFPDATVETQMRGKFIIEKQITII